MAWKMTHLGGRWGKLPGAKKPVVKRFGDIGGHGAKGPGIPSHRRGRGFEALRVHHKASLEVCFRWGSFVFKLPLAYLCRLAWAESGVRAHIEVGHCYTISAGS